MRLQLIHWALVCSIVCSIWQVGCVSPGADSLTTEEHPSVARAEDRSSAIAGSALLFPAINVLDLDVSEKFYVDLLGMKVTLRLNAEGEERRELTLNFTGDMMAEESSIVLNEVVGRNEPYVSDALSRIAFRVPDVEMLVERIRLAGFEVLSEPRRIEVNEQVFKLAFVRDPDGTRLELIERVTE